MIIFLTVNSKNKIVHVSVSVSGCDDVVGPEGMEKFCEDIGVEPENVKQILMNLINADTGLACYIVNLIYLGFFLHGIFLLLC